VQISYSPDGWAEKCIRDMVADGQPKDTSVRELMERTQVSANTVQHVLGHMQSMNEIEVKGSYHGGDFEDHFEIRKGIRDDES
jgi:hypothetical protein